jgi:hypothetical protein
MLLTMTLDFPPMLVAFAGTALQGPPGNDSGRVPHGSPQTCPLPRWRTGIIVPNLGLTKQ